MELAKYVRTEMGKVTNLITDMCLRGATADEMERVTKYSMAVIDGVKRGINHILQSAKDNGIADLKTKCQSASG